MAAKPSAVPEFNSSSGVNNTEPSPQKKASGWAPGEKPKAQYFNWLFRLIWQWIQYLSDGAFSGAHTFDSTVSVTGALSALSTFAATGLITATAGLTAAVNQHITVSGTGRFKHGALSLPIAAASFQPSDMSGGGTLPILSGGTWTFAGTTPGDRIQAGFSLPVGARLISVTWVFNKGGNAIAMEFTAFKRDLVGGGSATVIGGSPAGIVSDTTSGSSYKSAASPTFNETIASGFQYWLEAKAGHSAHRFGHAVLSYDTP